MPDIDVPLRASNFTYAIVSVPFWRRPTRRTGRTDGRSHWWI